ncbi:HipA family kinase [Siphonobacter aquaeclarae]|uniref:HipA-like kinase domain-containing protein n=1 Tax=Siphonobacter aquaeclarae TaxID=563176 RepID=A0A1G9HV59_9BACT|nr:HipA family kinase [Siphonobacter aquaeclarae]SDL16857.1 hypothetical protein SAMN04488090_0221 [Siphonobacter aquaeclarae]
MAISRVLTNAFIEEINTDGHAPVKFLCEDGNLYYCKNRITLNKFEIDLLAYEVICNRFLKYLNISTPDIALVEVAAGTWFGNRLSKNKKYLKPGIVCFGSKDIPDSVLITDLFIDPSRSWYKKIYNLQDLIRIAIFDIWVNNVDRGRQLSIGRNYNLLLSDSGNGRLIHAFAFGGPDHLRFFHPRLPFSASNTLISSELIINCTDLFSYSELLKIVDDFLSLCLTSVKPVLSDVFDDFSPTWNIPPDLLERVSVFLLDSERFERVDEMVRASLKI